MVILQINFHRPDIPAKAWEARFTEEVAQPFVDLPGLKWKIWIDAPDQSIGGGLYLFETRADAEAYLQGPIVARMKKNPDYINMSLRVFEVFEPVSKLTRAPID